MGASGVRTYALDRAHRAESPKKQSLTEVQTLARLVQSIGA